MVLSHFGHIKWYANDYVGERRSCPRAICFLSLTPNFTSLQFALWQRDRDKDRQREREVWKRNNWTMCWYHWVYWCLDYTTFGFCSLSSAFPDEPSLVSMLKLATNGSSPWWVLSPSSLSLSLSLCVCTLQALTSYVYIYIYIYVWIHTT